MSHDPDANAKAFAHVLNDLSTRFPTIPADVISEHLARTRAEFDTAAVHEYVPVLVERHVRQLLTELAASGVESA